MSMTMRGHTNLGGGKAVINPFMDNAPLQRVTIEVDNSYNRGYIPPFSLWAPSDHGTTPLYMPYMPAINIVVANSTTSLDIPNEWVDYFRVGDEVIVMDVSTLASDNLAFRGQSSDDLSAVALGTDSSAISGVGVKDSGGTGNVLITLGDALNSAATGGVLGTGDILVLAGSDTSTAIKAYQQAARIVIMEQGFNFKAPVDGQAAGNGGILVESAVYTYSMGRIDENYIEYFDNLNDTDTSPALTVATTFTNYSRFNFESIYRG